MESDKDTATVVPHLGPPAEYGACVSSVRSALPFDAALGVLGVIGFVDELLEQLDQLLFFQRRGSGSLGCVRGSLRCSRGNLGCVCGVAFDIHCVGVLARGSGRGRILSELWLLEDIICQGGLFGLLRAAPVCPRLDLQDDLLDEPNHQGLGVARAAEEHHPWKWRHPEHWRVLSDSPVQREGHHADHCQEHGGKGQLQRRLEVANGVGNACPQELFDLGLRKRHVFQVRVEILGGRHLAWVHPPGDSRAWVHPPGDSRAWGYPPGTLVRGGTPSYVGVPPGGVASKKTRSFKQNTKLQTKQWDCCLKSFHCFVKAFHRCFKAFTVFL